MVVVAEEDRVNHGRTTQRNGRASISLLTTEVEGQPSVDNVITFDVAAYEFRSDMLPNDLRHFTEYFETHVQCPSSHTRQCCCRQMWLDKQYFVF